MLGHRTPGLDPFDVAAQLPARRGAPAVNARLMRLPNLTLDSARGWVTVLLSGSASYVKAMLSPRIRGEGILVATNVQKLSPHFD
jgi:hypothetical protein